MIIGGSVLAIGGFGILYTRVQNLPKGRNVVTAFLVAIIAVSVSFVGAGVAGIVLAEDNDLMGRLGEESREFLVVTASEEICGVLENDDDVVCVGRNKVFNDEVSSLGEPAAHPYSGKHLKLVKVKIEGQEGVLFRQVPK